MAETSEAGLEISFEPGSNVVGRTGAYLASHAAFSPPDVGRHIFGQKSFTPPRAGVQPSGHGQHGRHCGTFDVNVSSPDGASLVIARDGEAPEVFPMPASDSYFQVYACGGDGGAPRIGGYHPGKGGRGGDVRIITNQLELVKVLQVFTSGGNGSAKGPAGGLEYLVRSPDGVSFRANDMYNLSLKSFNVVSNLADGVVQPGDTMQLVNVIVTNTGSLPLPAGTLIRFGQHESNNVLSLVGPLNPIALPLLLPGQDYVLPEPVVCAVADLHPRQRAGLARAQGYGTVGLLNMYGSVIGRFALGETIKANIEWPVALKAFTIPKDCSLGTNFKFKITLDNISSKPFTMERQDGIRVRLWIDRRVAPKIGRAQDAPLDSPLIPFDVRVPSLEALRSMDLVVNLPLSPTAPIENYDKFAIEIELFYNNILIQWSEASIRVSPSYSPDARQDVVFFTGSWLDKDSFHVWELLFRKLGLAFQVWDVDYIGSFVRRVEENGTETTWRRPGGPDRRILLMPVPQIGNNPPNLATLPWEAIIEHSRSFPAFQSPGAMHNIPAVGPPEIMSRVYENLGSMRKVRPEPAASDFTTPLSPMATGNIEDDWGVIIGHHDTGALRDCILNASPTLDMSEWWIERFLVKTPATRHAERSANALLAQAKAIFPASWVDFMPSMQKENIQRIADTNWYSFGRLFFGLSPMRRVSKVHGVHMMHLREIARVHDKDEPLLETSPQLPAGPGANRIDYGTLKMEPNWLSIPCNFRDWFLMLVSALPIERQLLLLMDADIAAQKWVVMAREGPKLFNLVKSSSRSPMEVTMVDFLMNLLFWELRWDTIIQDSTCPRWTALLAACRTHAAQFVENKKIAMVISYATRRCELNKNGNVANLARDTKKQIEEALYGSNPKKNPANIAMKKERDAYMEKHAKRLYLSDFIRHNAMFALANRIPAKDYWMRIEREHVWCDDL
eukprot:TRINITY_DN9999_c0_g1_i1.p1 TRINITY_DN9999_c0_g1~~TRINITY_DN9999_c0_g1_i1.p1  ORF type:complete len:957 (+),score=112.25 TRINITY_DN9999_c0_g1_i1:45-2915(+)